MKEYRFSKMFRHNSRYRPDSKFIGIYAYSPLTVNMPKDGSKTWTVNGLKEYQEYEIVRRWLTKHHKHFDKMDFNACKFYHKNGNVYVWQRGGDYDRGMYYKRNIVLEEFIDEQD